MFPSFLRRPSIRWRWRRDSLLFWGATPPRGSHRCRSTGWLSVSASPSLWTTSGAFAVTHDMLTFSLLIKLITSLPLTFDVWRFQRFPQLNRVLEYILQKYCMCVNCGLDFDVLSARQIRNLQQTAETSCYRASCNIWPCQTVIQRYNTS